MCCQVNLNDLKRFRRRWPCRGSERQPLLDETGDSTANGSTRDVQAASLACILTTLAMTLPIPLISSNPERLGGEPCFTGTRVPVRALIDYVEGGHPLAEFLSDFPAVSREHAVAVLELARQALLSQAVTTAA